MDKLLFVPLPTPKDRVAILKALAVNVKLSPEVDLTTIGTSERADGYSGADCAALLREAGLAVLKESIGQAEPEFLMITPRHFDYAFTHVVPSVSKKDQARYNRVRDRIAHARSRGAVVSDVGAVEEVEEVPVEDPILVEAAAPQEQLSNVSERVANDDDKSENTAGCVRET